MNLPASIHERLVQYFGTSPTAVRLIGGGDISNVVACTFGDQRCLIKWLPQLLAAPSGWADMFAAEAHGLDLLRTAGALRVPAVYLYAASEPNCPAFIAMEWIDTAQGAERRAAGAALGVGLAAQHRCSAAAYGLDQNNYCGATPQPNEWRDSWIGFYGEQRLGTQLALAARQGRMPTARRQRLERLIAQLDRWIDERAVMPALLHGDLWGGNWLVADGATPVLIDPATYYGDREADLAMCHLFGGFPAAFFAAYDEAWPPAPGRDERIPLYQLYHLLNHLNLFGESYGSQIDAVLRRYVG